MTSQSSAHQYMMFILLVSYTAKTMKAIHTECVYAFKNMRRRAVELKKNKKSNLYYVLDQSDPQCICEMLKYWLTEDAFLKL